MMLRESTIIPKVAAILTDEDFYRQENRIVFRALLNIYNRGTPPDILLIENELRRTGEIDQVERAYLFSLIDMEFTTARAEAQATVIKEKAILRRLIQAGEEIADEARNEQNIVEDVLESAEKKILSVTSKTTQIGFERLATVLQRCV